MDRKEQYQKQMQAQLDQWKAELDKLKAKARGAQAEANIEMDKQIEAFERRMEEGRGKLAALSQASEDSWEAMRKNMESTWDSMKKSFNEAAAKLRD